MKNLQFSLEVSRKWTRPSKRLITVTTYDENGKANKPKTVLE